MYPAQCPAPCPDAEVQAALTKQRSSSPIQSGKDDQSFDVSFVMFAINIAEISLLIIPGRLIPNPSPHGEGNTSPSKYVSSEHLRPIN